MAHSTIQYIKRGLVLGDYYMKAHANTFHLFGVRKCIAYCILCILKKGRKKGVFTQHIHDIFLVTVERVLDYLLCIESFVFEPVYIFLGVQYFCDFTFYN